MSNLYTKMKGGVGSVGSSKTASDAKSALSDLVVYAATIIIALAYNSLALSIFARISDAATDDVDLVYLYIYAAVTIVFAMIVCFLTGESLSFGEDIA
ncbi:hypothetical protein DIPPA_20772 [Diplonema papillatum]|nr:hypothetical protein DIPPA_20772 [Diplonema papillatum]